MFVISENAIKQIRSLGAKFKYTTDGFQIWDYISIKNGKETILSILKQDKVIGCIFVSNNFIDFIY